MLPDFSSPDDVVQSDLVQQAIARDLVAIRDGRVHYSLNAKRSYAWSDPEEWVRCFVIAYLVLRKDYPANRIKTEVIVPRRTPTDYADVVVYSDDACRQPYLVVETKQQRLAVSERNQAVEQLFGNANSLRAPYGLFDSGGDSTFFNVANFPSMERLSNVVGDRERIAPQYGNQPFFFHVVGDETDISPANKAIVEARIKQAHSLIWAGGKRDPLRAFDEWSKLLFAKVHDERWTQIGQARKFQVGTNETSAAVANRVHRLFREAILNDPDIFDAAERIDLPDRKDRRSGEGTSEDIVRRHRR